LALAHTKLEEILSEVKNFPYAMILHASVSFDRAKVFRKEDKEKSDSFINQAIEKLTILSDLQLSEEDKEETYLLWFEIIAFQTKSPANSNSQNESLWTDAGHKLTIAADISNPSRQLYDACKLCLDSLVSTPRDRERNGAVAFVISGEFMKHGGERKTWKTRWFVADDHRISYYKDKKEWETGPVKGNAKEPQGEISYAEITSIYAHKDFFCSEIEKERPKGTENTYCLHIKTSFGRTYNIIGFSSYELTQTWIKVLNQAIKTNNVTRALKTFLKAKERLKTKEPTIRQIPSPKEVEKAKKETTEEQILYRPRWATQSEVEKRMKTTKTTEQ